MDNPVESGPKRRYLEGEEIDFSRLYFQLWRFRLFILLGTLVATLLGLAYGMLATPVYRSQATIALKEAGKGNDASRIISQFGGMGGMVASQLGLGNTSLNKVGVILKGYELAEAVVSGNNLMPVLFAEQWNPKVGAWVAKDSSQAPTLRQGAEIMRRGILSVVLDVKTNMIFVGANFSDPVIAKQFVDYYLAALNAKIRSDVIRDAEENREYLERQLNITMDPILREKIQNMIGMEIEKSMLVSSQAFEILEKPMAPLERAKPKKKIILILSFLIGAFASITAVLAWSGMAGLRGAAKKWKSRPASETAVPV